MKHSGRSREQNKNLLLTGKPGVGKTTVVESLVQDFRRDFGGFFTREIRQGGVRKGFGLATVDGKNAILAHTEVESPIRVGKYRVDVAALESVGVQALKNALAQKRGIVIDEIGKMELASQKFREVVLEALASDRIVLATVHAHSHPFTDAIKTRRDVTLYQVTPENRNALPNQLEEVLARLLCDLTGG